jgi:NarL family two-component system response regulator LiaR
MMSEVIHVLVADELPMVREGIRSILNAADNAMFVGEATNSQEVLSSIQMYRPDVLLLSLDLPHSPSLVIITQAQEICPTTKTLAIASDSSTVRRYRLVAAGVRGCILKSETADAILSAIRAVYYGELWFSQPILQKLLEQEPYVRSLAIGMRLTKREVEVLRLIARGGSNQQIAEVLFITERTVKYHTRNIYAKLNVSSRAQAINWAWRHKLEGDS